MTRRPFIRVGTRSYSARQIRECLTLTNAHGVSFARTPTGIVCYTEAPELAALLIRNAHALACDKPLGATVAIVTFLPHH